MAGPAVPPMPYRYPGGFGVQLQSSRERSQDLRGRVLGTSALETQVVLDADNGQHCQLLAPQVTSASAPTSDQPDFLGLNLIPPRTQEIP